MNKTNKEKNAFNLKKFIFKEKSLEHLLNNDISNIFKDKLKSNKNNKKKPNLEIHTNSFNSYDKKKLTSKSNLKRNKTAKFLNVFPKKELTKEDKIKMTMIIKNFTKNKLATKELFKIEKKLPLNSINQSSFNFINNEDSIIKNKSKQKYNIKNMEKSFSLSNLLTSSMIDKFNNKTNEILDKPFKNRIKFSKNIFNFRKQIINNFSEQENHLGNAEKSKNKYLNALEYLDKTKDIQIQKFIKSEEQFYKLRNKEIGIYEIDTNEEEEDNNTDSNNNNTRLYSFKSSKNLDVGNYNDDEHINKSMSKTFKARAFSSKNVKYNFRSFSSSKKILKNVFDKQNNKNLNHVPNEKSFENEERKKPSSKKINSYTSINYENNVQKNNKKINFNFNNFYNYKNKSQNKIKNQIPIFKSRSEQKMFNIKQNFLLYQKSKIVERSKKFAESMANMYFFQYNPKNYIDYKNATMNINTKNLTRVIKLNRINKYLCDVEDDDLLVMNSKKLRDLMKQAEMKYYLCNKKDLQLSYLRKHLKPQTLNKFSRIKNSFFGFPC